MSAAEPIEIDYFADETNVEVLHSRAASGMAYTAVAQGLRVVISIVSQIVLSRLLFPEQFGIVAMVAPVLAIVSLFSNLGLSQAVIQRERISQAQLTGLYWLTLGISCCIALVLAACSPLVGWAYHRPEVGPVCAALALQIPISAVAGHASALMSRKMRFKAIAVIEVTTACISLIVSIVCAFLHMSYWSLVIGQIVGNLSQALAERKMSGWRPSRPKWDASVGPMLRFGANLTGFSLLSLFSQYADNVLVGILRGPDALGLFDKAFSLVLRPMGAVTSPISRVATPLLARLVNDQAAYRRAFLTMFQATVFLVSPGMLVGSLMSAEVVRVFLGNRWAGTSPIMTWICIAAIFTPLPGTSYWLFSSQDRTGEQLRCGFISSGLILVSMLAGLPWGPIGIARSYAAFAPLVHGCFIWTATRRGPVRGNDALKATFPIFACLAAAGAVIFWLHRLHMPDLAKIAAGTVGAYLVAALIFLLFPQGRVTLKTLRGILARRKAATV